MSELLIAILGAVIGLVFSLTCLWMSDNYTTHTSEWHNERLIDWLKRPLPNCKNNRRELDKYFREMGYDDIPYCLIDAILDPKKTVDEVIKWTILYSVSDDEFRSHDKEYERVLLKS